MLHTSDIYSFPELYTYPMSVWGYVLHINTPKPIIIIVYNIIVMCVYKNPMGCLPLRHVSVADKNVDNL